MNQKRNPAKKAVALRCDGSNAPRITAKGHGSVADEIIALAKEHGVPLQENGELAALLAQLELNDEIPRELYLAVAEVLDADLATGDRALGAAGDRFVGLGAAPGHRLSEPVSAYGAERPATWPDYSGAASYLASSRVGLRTARSG